MARARPHWLVVAGAAVTAAWVLEGPRNGTTNQRLSWRFVASNLDAGAQLCVGVIGGGGACADAVRGRVAVIVALQDADAENVAWTDFRVYADGTAAAHVEVRTLGLEPSPRLVALRAAPLGRAPLGVDAAPDAAALRAALRDRRRRQAAECTCANGLCERAAPGEMAVGQLGGWNVNEQQVYWLVSRLFKDVYGGTFVEAGAADIYTAVTDLFERHWAAQSARHRPGVLVLEGALCSGEPGPRGFLLNGHESGLIEGGGAETTVTCHSPAALLAAAGVKHVDLFVLDCEGCEADVLEALLSQSATEVDVWVVEANDFARVRKLLDPTHDLLACIGTMDAVFARRGSQPWRRFFDAEPEDDGAPAADAKLEDRCPLLRRTGEL